MPWGFPRERTSLWYPLISCVLDQDDSEQWDKIFIFFPPADLAGNFLTKRVFIAKCWFSQNCFSSISLPENTASFVSFCCWRIWASGINGSSAVPAQAFSSLWKIWSLPGSLEENWTPEKSPWRQRSWDFGIQLNSGLSLICRGLAKRSLLGFFLFVYFSSVSERMGSGKENPQSMGSLCCTDN